MLLYKKLLLMTFGTILVTSERQHALVHPQKVWYDQLWLSWNGFYSPTEDEGERE